MQTGSIAWIIFMLYKIITSKKKDKISIKQPNGGNKKLMPIMKDFEDISLMKRFVQVKDIHNNLMHNTEKPKTKTKNTEIKSMTKVSVTVANSQKPAQEACVSQVAFNTDTLDKNKKTTTKKVNDANTVIIDDCPITGSNYDVSDFHFTYDYNNGTGELYMRVGIAIFSVCTLIDRCLNLVQMLEVYINASHALKDCSLGFVINTFSVITSIFFIFLQSFFIFKVRNLKVNFSKIFSCYF